MVKQNTAVFYLALEYRSLGTVHIVYTNKFKVGLELNPTRH